MSSSNLSDEENFADRLSNARSGSTDDRANLVESFRKYLRNIAAETIGNEPTGQLSASDLVQSAIIDAHQGFALCRATTHDEFKAWLRRILLNDIMNRYRNLRRQKRDVGREQQIGSKHDIAEEIDSPSQQLIRDEEEGRLFEAMSQLKPEQRQVIELRQRENLSFVEIADQLGRTPDSTRMLWNRAIDTLARILQDRNTH